MDIEKSRAYAIKERTYLQRLISDYVTVLNTLFEENIEYDVTFSAGDELQGLFKDTTVAVMYFRLLELLLKPVKIRAGIGVGEWTIKINDGSSTQQDGPAYHRARQAIQEVYNNSFHNIRICSEQDDIMANHLVNAARELKNQQIYMQNMVLVILEVLSPFVKRGMDMRRTRFMEELLEIKASYRLSGFSAAGSNAKAMVEKKDTNLFHVSSIPFIEAIYVDGNMLDMERKVVVKNISSVIGEMLDCSRQNVESILKRGNAYKIRELDYMALQYIERMYRE